MRRFHDLPKRFEGSSKQYHIYALVDPRYNTTCYVGMSKDAQVRLYQHLRSGCGQCTMHWIAELQQIDMRPILQILETVNREDSMSPSEFRYTGYASI